MPSKLLIAAAEAAHAVREAPVFGIATGPAQVDGGAVMARVRAFGDDFVGLVLEVVEDFPSEHRLAGHVRFIAGALMASRPRAVHALGGPRAQMSAAVETLDSRGGR